VGCWGGVGVRRGGLEKDEGGKTLLYIIII